MFNKEFLKTHWLLKEVAVLCTKAKTYDDTNNGQLQKKWRNCKLFILENCHLLTGDIYWLTEQAGRTELLFLAKAIFILIVSFKKING